MKSKKSIFVVALAALMLIAFTACEQPANIWNPNGKVPTALNITQSDAFVVGQPFDASKFSVEVVYENGDKETTSAANVTLVKANAESTVAYVEMGDKVAASLSTVSTAGMTATVKTESAIAVSTIDSLEIDAPETWVVGDEMKSEDVAVVASYRTASGVETLTLDPSEYTVELATGSAGDEVTGTIKVWMSAPTDDSGTGFKTGTFTTELIAKSTAEWDGTIAIRVKEGKTPAFIQRAKLEATAINNVYEVVKNMDDGTTEVLDTTELAKVEYTLDSYYTHTGETDIKRFPVSGTVTLTATYNYADPDTKLVTPVTATISMNLLQDYPKFYSAKSVTAGQPGSTNELAITVGESIAESYFTVTATWASGLAGVNVSVNDFDVAPGTAPTVDTAKQVPVTLKWLGDKYSDLAVDPEVQVWVKPSV